MSFLGLNTVFVSVAAVALALAVVLRRDGVHRPGGVVGAAAVSFFILAVLTAVFDNVMIASGLFDYGQGTLTGAKVGLAPLEDFAYPLAAVLLLPGLWLLLTRKGAQK